MLREIVAKTLVGRGKVSYFYERELLLNEAVSKTLVCWIINLNYEVKYDRDDIYLEGYYSIQLWYAKDNDSIIDCLAKISFKSQVGFMIHFLSNLEPILVDVSSNNQNKVP